MALSSKDKLLLITGLFVLKKNTPLARGLCALTLYYFSPVLCSISAVANLSDLPRHFPKKCFFSKVCR